jgi:beta-galactosidase
LIRVVCFSNCEQAELLLNGESLGVRDLLGAEDHALFWDVPFQRGTLTAKGLKDAKTVATCELRTCGVARRIVAEADTNMLQADGVDLAHVIVTLVDENGVPVWTGNQEVSWAIEGPARLLGLESGDPGSHEDYQSHTRRAFHGRMAGYLQSIRESGMVHIRLSAPGLEDAQIVLQANAVLPNG